MEKFKNLQDLIQLSKKEIENNNPNISATLDLTDLKELKLLLEEYKEKEYESLVSIYWKNRYIDQVKYGNKVTLTGDEVIPRVINAIKKDYVSKEKIKAEKVKAEQLYKKYQEQTGRLRYEGKIVLCEQLLGKEE